MENQKEWYYGIIDEMESAHVIQKVLGDFIKCLNSMNLAPKEAGKMGATRVEILCKVNVECIKNSLPCSVRKSCTLGKPTRHYWMWSKVKDPQQSN